MTHGFAIPSVAQRSPGALRQLFTWRSGPTRRRSAAIAGLCTVVPVLVGQALSQPRLGLIASTGALAALYAGRGSARQEVRAVGFAAIGLSLSFGLGSVLAGHLWAGIIGNALWAGLVAAVCALGRSRPPGVVMPVLLCTVGSALPAGDAGSQTAAVAAVSACATFLSWAVVPVTRWLGRNPPNPLDARPPGRVVHQKGTRARPDSSLRRAGHEFFRSPLPLMSVRAASAVAIAGAAAVACGDQRPSWAMATAGAVLASGSHASAANSRALSRGTGTALGCVLSGALALSQPQGAFLGLVLGALTYLIEIVVARNYALAMIFVTPLSTSLVAAASPSTPALTLTTDRLVETVIGCLAAVLAGQSVTRGWALAQRRRAIVATLEATADSMESPSSEDRAAAVEAAIFRIQLVSDRTAGERRAVRNAVRVLDETADEVHAMARAWIQDTRGPGSPATGQIETLRALAASLRDGTS